MTPLEKEILVGVYRLREELRGRDWQGADGAARIAIDGARRLGMVPTAFSPWATGLDVSGRKAVSRTYAALEVRGLLLRHGNAGKTSHLSLTPEGEQTAKSEATTDA